MDRPLTGCKYREAKKLGLPTMKLDEIRISAFLNLQAFSGFTFQPDPIFIPQGSRYVLRFRDFPKPLEFLGMRFVSTINPTIFGRGLDSLGELLFNKST